MKTDWEGYYLDGKTANRQSVTIQIMRLGLHITPEIGAALWWPYQDIRQTQGSYEGEEVRLERGGEFPEILLIPDSSFLASLHQLAPELSHRYHNPARRNLRVRLTIYAAFGIVGVTTALYLWGIPAFAEFVTPYVPYSWEESLGASLEGYLAPNDKRCTDPKLNRAVERVINRLLDKEKNVPYKFRVHVVDLPMINAAAIPGGTILLFRGLVEKTRSPEELAGVLSHELQHILQRHSMRALIQHFSTGLLLSAIIGDTSGLAEVGAEAAQLFAVLRYSRKNETEADAKGLQMLLAADVNPDGMISFFEEILKQDRDAPAALQFLSTHPNTEERINRLKSLVQGSKIATKKLLPGDNWEQIKKLCVAKTTTS